MKNDRNLQVRTTQNYVKSKKNSRKNDSNEDIATSMPMVDIVCTTQHWFKIRRKCEKEKRPPWSMISKNAKIKVRISTSMVLPASLSSSFSPKHGITFNPDWRANPTWEKRGTIYRVFFLLFRPKND